MTGRALVPKTTSAPDSTASLMGLLRELVHEVAKWVDAEIALVQAEAGTMMRRVVVGLLVLLASFATMIAAIVSLAGVGVQALAPLLGSVVMAGLVVSLVLLLLMIILGLVARQMFVSVKRPGSSLMAWVRSAPWESSTK